MGETIEQRPGHLVAEVGEERARKVGRGGPGFSKVAAVTAQMAGMGMGSGQEGRGPAADVAAGSGSRDQQEAGLAHVP